MRVNGQLDSFPETLAPASKRPASDMEKLKADIEEQIRTTHVLVYCKTTCPFCTKVRRRRRRG